MAFVMQAEGMKTVLANEQAGVQILYLPCRIEPDLLEITGGNLSPMCG